MNLNSIPKSESDILLNSWGYDLIEEYSEYINNADFSNNSFVFDAATGSGRSVSVLTRYGFNVVSGDYNFTSMPDVERRVTAAFINRVNFVRLNLEKIPFRNSSVNNIICMNTLHEVENPVICLKEIIRIHNREGNLLISDFNAEGYDVMDRLHKIKTGGLHPRGNIVFDEVFDIVQANYKSVKKINTRLNWGLVLNDLQLQ